MRFFGNEHAQTETKEMNHSTNHGEKVQSLPCCFNECSKGHLITGIAQLLSFEHPLCQSSVCNFLFSCSFVV